MKPWRIVEWAVCTRSPARRATPTPSPASACPTMALDGAPDAASKHPSTSRSRRQLGLLRHPLKVRGIGEKASREAARVVIGEGLSKHAITALPAVREL